MTMPRSLGLLLVLVLVLAAHPAARGHTAPASAWTEASLCAEVRAAIEGFALRQGGQGTVRAEVRCRPVTLRPISRLAKVQVELSPADGLLRSGNQVWPVRVQPERGPGYVLALPVAITWVTPGWVLARDQKAGDWLQATDLQIQEVAWPAGAPVEMARADEPAQGRLRRTLQAGALVRSADLIAADALQRGDRVTVVLASGGIEMTMPAQVLAPARVGQRVTVQAYGRHAPLEGRLVDLTTVRVNNP